MPNKETLRSYFQSVIDNKPFFFPIKTVRLLVDFIYLQVTYSISNLSPHEMSLLCRIKGWKLISKNHAVGLEVFIPR